MRRGLVAFAVHARRLLRGPHARCLELGPRQIKVVVANGLMGPSVSNFRAKQNITRAELGTAIAALTGESQVVVDPDAEVTIASSTLRS